MGWSLAWGSCSFPFGLGRAANAVVLEGTLDNFINGLQNYLGFGFAYRANRSWFFVVRWKRGQRKLVSGHTIPVHVCGEKHSANAPVIVCRGGADNLLAGRASCLRVVGGEFAGEVGQNS